MSMYGKNYYNIVISLQLIKNKWKKNKKIKAPTIKKKKNNGTPIFQYW